MKFTSIFVAAALLASSVSAGDGDSVGGMSLQAQLRGLKERLAADEAAVKKLADKECTDDAVAVVGLTGVAADGECASLGVLSGCDAGSHSSSLAEKASSNYDQKCACGQRERQVQKDREKDLAKLKKDLADAHASMKKESADVEKIIKEFPTSVLDNMDNAVKVIKQIRSHVNEKTGELSTPVTNLVQSASKAMNKMSGGEHLSALLQVAAEEARKYKAANLDQSTEEDTSKSALNLHSICTKLIEYILSAKQSIEGEIKRERSELVKAEKFHQTETIRFNKWNNIYSAQLTRAIEKKKACFETSRANKARFDQIVKNAKASHDSYQSYHKDLQKEKRALTKVYEILEANHKGVTSKAVEIANKRNAQTTGLYELDDGWMRETMKEGKNYLSHFLVSNKRQRNYKCGVSISKKDDTYFQTPEVNEWTPYYYDGQIKSGCGGCNNGVGIDLGSHYFGVQKGGEKKCAPSHIDRAAAFAWTNIFVKGKESVRVFWEGGADDGYVVRNNGKPLAVKGNGGVHGEYLTNCRCYDLNVQDQKFSITLQPGMNKIVTKVGEAGGHWGFVFRLTPEKGRADDIEMVWPGKKTYKELFNVAAAP